MQYATWLAQSTGEPCQKSGTGPKIQNEGSDYRDLAVEKRAVKLTVKADGTGRCQKLWGSRALEKHVPPLSSGA